jgi:hypothetical protein
LPVADGDAGSPTGTTASGLGLPSVMGLIISFLYVLIMPYAGFALASAAMLVSFMLILGVRSVWILILLPVCEIAFLLYVFEKLLTLFLPNADALKAWLGLAA